MWDMFSNSFRLFLKGKLFRDPRAVLKQWLVGFAATLIVVLALKFAGLPLWLAVAIASLAGGALQPYLFRDLKYN